MGILIVGRSRCGNVFYCLEMVTAVSFRIQSKGSYIFRKYVMKRLYSGEHDNTILPVYFIVYREIFNLKRWDY